MKLKDIKLKTCPFCDGEVVCPHCRTIIGFDDDVGYFYDDTFYCEFCGQRLKRGIK